MDKNEFQEECLDARALIYENVKKELLGPGSEDINDDIEHEIITDPPITRYSTGILFPQKMRIGQEVDNRIDFEDNEAPLSDEENELIILKKRIENEENEIIKSKEFIESKDKISTNDYIIKEKNDDDIFNEKISLSNENKPSSMGLTFFAEGNVDKLNIRIKAAKYRKSTLKDCCVKYTGKDFFQGNILEDYVYRENNNLKLKKNLTYKIIREYRENEKINEDNEYRNFLSVLYSLSRQFKGEKNESQAYVREPIPFDETISINLEGAYTTYNVLPKEFNDRNSEKIELNLQVAIYVRTYEEDIKSYTVVLINNEEYGQYERDLKSIFQPEIKILSQDNKGLSFVEIKENNILNDNDIVDEEEKLKLLYTKRKNYAIGHGVSVLQNINDLDSTGELTTSFLPTYIVKGISFDLDNLSKNESDKILSMKNLSDYSELSKDEILCNLNKLVELYDKWIGNLSGEIKILEKKDPKFVKVAKNQINECCICSSRIKKGIKVLESDEKAYLAFQLMNRALMMQRIQGLHSKRERYPEDEKINYPRIDFKKEVLEGDAKWRPFQLAYVLLCLESISNPKCPDRELVDLIWVPTGGGKTEAYLGLTAFTIFLRRLRDKNNNGTTVIMRYTLRLLAAQQFTRASILICACELIRREMTNKLGKEKITIGLWIGSNQTPNTKEKAKKLYEDLTENTSSKNVLNHNKDYYNKFQVLKCPWCGTKLEKDLEIGNDWGYKFTGRYNKIFCTDYECEFCEDEGGLPIEVVDDCIYENPPTLLFGTVDKFAMITWNAGAGNLFGINNKKNNSPELIIQDELHLISGPLGTLVGEYETVIDILCSHNKDNIKPKIIASTATIRRAKQQCNQLYARDVKQFPPSGLYEDDSFFTKEDKNSAGRQYIGIMPTGKTLTTTQVRLMSALINRTAMLEIDYKVKSKYWTLVTYFNTLKELGMTRSLVEVDIQDNINSVSNRLLKLDHARRIFNIKELTSRVSSNEINTTLKDLEIEYRGENSKNKIYPIDLLLASNMISVGVDVSRLNLMMVLQQPKLTSEYIQATSRVGRENPGIIFTLYNPSRSRDKSFYESFYDYHQSFYKYVEPTSVTSFSEAARERMLHSVLVALVRHGVGLNVDDDASNFIEYEDEINIYKEKVINRVEKIMRYDNVLAKTIENELICIKEELDMFCEHWKNIIKDSQGKVKYSNYSIKKKDNDFRYLLKPYGKDRNIQGQPTLQAMRNVDKQGAVKILNFGDDNNE